MCGIAGYLTDEGLRPTDLGRTVGTMTDSLAHRGPDDRGIWCDPNHGIALGHRRLSILDLSPAGHQPMISSSGRYVIVYNGEVYSHHEMRAALDGRGIGFRGHSDTETMLEGFAAWGIESTLEKMIGMFALALWDRETRTLYLARDRIGVKPLYWGSFGGLFLFGSELKALRAHTGWTPALDRDALGAFMRHGYIPTPNSIYQGIHKLEPGCYLVMRAGEQPSVKRYWDFRSIVQRAVAGRRSWREDEAVDALDTLLRDAVKRRMEADVPLGAFLSGGIDSSTVVALMQAQSSRPVRTFSIGFRESEYNEAPYASAVAKHLKTDHTELYVEPAHALEVIPRIPDWFDEPFADSSQIPTFLVSELTRQHVTVSLSGDGGDELFGGYPRYQHAADLFHRTGRVPAWVRMRAASLLRSLPRGDWERLFGLVPHRWRPSNAGNKVYKLAASLEEANPASIYRRVISQWANPALVVPGATEPRGTLWQDSENAALVPDFFERMQFIDTLTYLPDDIMTKVDRASMAVSLEAREPLLDHRLVEFAWTLPKHLKVRRGESKWILRQVLYRYVPKTLIERPKMGFGVPIDHWLRGPLRDWAENLLDRSRIKRDGLLNPDPIHAHWQAHLSGRENWAYPLWNVLVFQAWLDHNPGIAH
jgi:asparagine synthase (glutamine-hydrolysing)